jgi:hypothetical protein
MTFDQFSIESILNKNQKEFNPSQNLINNNNFLNLFKNQNNLINTPTLAELQIFFGLNVRKHEYNRSRRKNIERKPRQVFLKKKINKTIKMYYY